MHCVGNTTGIVGNLPGQPALYGGFAFNRATVFSCLKQINDGCAI
jgi:hypothetical protein